MSFPCRVAGSVTYRYDIVRSSVIQEELVVESLLLQLRLFRPLNTSLLRSFFACATESRPQGRPRMRWRYYMSQLEKVTREREVWVFPA